MNSRWRMKEGRPGVRGKGSKKPDPAPSEAAFASLEQAYQRLEHLYEVGKLLASFESVEQSFDPALGIVAKSLPLQSAILIETENGRSRMIIWPSGAQDSEQTRVARAHAKAAYAYLSGATSIQSLELREQQGLTPLPLNAKRGKVIEKRFVVIPLAVARRSLFGALQLEGARLLHKEDLVFVNAIANQLAIALDRDRARRRDIARREVAEKARNRAEAESVAAERERLVAERSREKYEGLFSETAGLYEQAQRAVQMREQILGIVSHDLKNPLATILMTTGVLARPGGAGTRRADLVRSIERIQRAAERMLRLIEDLLDFASIQAGRLAIQRQPNDVGSMVTETLASFERVAQERRVRLTAEVEPGLPKVYCDRDRVLQVLSNLVGNATKATAEGGRVDIRVEAHGNESMFTVSDDGPGIREEDVKHLFDRYWRSGEAQYKGTGLGLAIARGIVDAHEGRLWVESEPGRGATFRFTVPTTPRVGGESPP